MIKNGGQHGRQSMRLAQLTAVLIPAISTSKCPSISVFSRGKNTLISAMNKHSITTWQDMHVHRVQLRPDSTLNIGQCFNWKKLPHTSAEIWVGVLANKACLIKQTESSTEYLQLDHSSKHSDNALFMSYLSNYFQLEYDLCSMYKAWGAGCSRMQVVTDMLEGVRVVRQDPWECLISFICSSNNNIPRITQMLDKLRRRYGSYICTLELAKCSSLQLPDDALPIDNVPAKDASTPLDSNSSYYWRVSHNQLAHRSDQDAGVLYSQELYSFPTVNALASASEEELRSLGMGYRAKFILGSAQLVQQKSAADDVHVKQEREAETADGSHKAGGGAAWFEKLRHLASTARQCETSSGSPFANSELQESTVIKHEHTSIRAVDVHVQSRVEEARLLVQKELLQLPGVGRKVADCVALFSLDQTSALPVDTHVWNIAIRDYAPQLRRSHVKDENIPDTPHASDLTSPAGQNKRKGSSRVNHDMAVDGNDALISPISSPLGLSSPEPVDSIETKSLTPAVYEAVGDVFRSRFGPYAGWAHSVLFAAELATFREQLPAHMQEQMKSFANLQRSAKKVKRDEKKGKQAKEKDKLLVTDVEDIQAALNIESPSVSGGGGSLSALTDRHA